MAWLQVGSKGCFERQCPGYKCTASSWHDIGSVTFLIQLDHCYKKAIAVLLWLKQIINNFCLESLMANQFHGFPEKILHSFISLVFPRFPWFSWKKRKFLSVVFRGFPWFS